MRLCFLIEEHYRHDGMPNDVVRQLTAWGHQVDVLYPGGSPVRLADTVRAGRHDAWVLKTVSGGPGLTLLEAAAAVGLVTVNDARSIRPVRDKALAAVIAEHHGLPVPRTYAAARPELLAELPDAEFPLVVKPAAGSSGRAVTRVASPEEMVRAADRFHGEELLIAQPYVPNPGTDLKVYCVGGQTYGTQRPSPLHPEAPRGERPVPVPAEVARLADEVGAVFGLDLYGIDVLLGPDGPVIVDINDFPSFRQVPNAVARVARAVLRLAASGGRATAAAPAGAVPAVACGGGPLAVPVPGAGAPAAELAAAPAGVGASLRVLPGPARDVTGTGEA